MPYRAGVPERRHIAAEGGEREGVIATEGCPLKGIVL